MAASGPASGYDVAIIGQGFSGTMVLANLVRHANIPLKIAVFDASVHRGRGVAYATPRSEHLLNVRAGNMSAHPDHSHDFYDWTHGEDGQKACTKLGISPPDSNDSFAPRALYGAYLEAIARHTTKHAAEKNIAITYHDELVRELSPDGVINHRHHARQIVLACGLSLESEVPVWQFDYESLRGRDDTVAIIGTGLTAVDTIISLLDVGFRGAIECISRHGVFALPHATHHQPASFAMPSPALMPLSQMMDYLRDYAREACIQGYQWQDAMDAIRPHTTALWQRLSAPDRTRMIRRYFTLWNIHRHRMAPEIHDRLQAAMASGQVRITQGSCTESSAHHAVIKTGAGTRRLEAAQLFDCRGPRYDALPDCISPLLKSGAVRLHESGVGLAADAHGCLHYGEVRYYAIGALLLGERLETTAVPDLRGQCDAVARALLS